MSDDPIRIVSNIKPHIMVATEVFDAIEKGLVHPRALLVYRYCCEYNVSVVISKIADDTGLSNIQVHTYLKQLQDINSIRVTVGKGLYDFTVLLCYEPEGAKYE